MGGAEQEHIELRAQDIIRRAANGCLSRYYGSWTASIYDTAWVSMVISPQGQWLFPESFEYILDHQGEGTGWRDGASEIDGILNTMAALLAIQTRLAKGRAEPQLKTTDPAELERRASYARQYLQAALDDWNVLGCMHVGFEILVPALLDMLADYGVTFAFPGRAALDALNKQKLERFDVKYLYGPQQLTVLHSLEAFAGKCDFSKVLHHQTGGSMLGSPSATAALLMHAPEWNTEAEAYLRDVIQLGGGAGRGGVPSAWPCDIFELTWVSTTFIEAGLQDTMLRDSSFIAALDKLQNTLEKQEGVVGFAPGFLVDADDTAKSIFLLNSMGRPVPAKPLISRFMSKKGHIMTYVGERDLSISANCNALNALLYSTDFSDLHESVFSIVSSLCDSWFCGQVKDKWNLSPDYSSMLLAQALTSLLRLTNDGTLNNLPEDLLRHKIPIVLTQILNEILFSSSQDAPSDLCEEVVAYRVLTLVAICDLPWYAAIHERIKSVLSTYKTYLRNRESLWNSAPFLWIEKVTYGFKVICEAYCVAAVVAEPKHTPWSSTISELVPLKQAKKIAMLAKWFQLVYSDAKEPQWKLDASLIEGTFFVERLKVARRAAFPKLNSLKDSYLEYIPAVWTIVNNACKLRVAPNVLWEMMVISMQGYLVDEFIESKIPTLDSLGRSTVVQFVKKTITHLDSADMQSSASPELENIYNVLRTYMNEVLHHPAVVRASAFDRAQVRKELGDYLVAHLIQIEDNIKYFSTNTAGALPSPPPSSSDVKATADTDDAFQPTLSFPPLASTFYTWSHTTASYHTSCQLSFAFLSCLLSPPDGGDCFASPEEKYRANDLCSHLAVMSRLYNDYGSVARDQREGNLNSVNFPECQPLFADTQTGEEYRQMSFGVVKSGLLNLAGYERRCARTAMEELFAEMDRKGKGTKGDARERCRRGVRLFAGAAELFADMYVAKDITNTVSASGRLAMQAEEPSTKVQGQKVKMEDGPVLAATTAAVAAA